MTNDMKYSEVKEAIPETEMVGIRKPMPARGYLWLLASSIADAEGKDINSVTLGDIVDDLSGRTRGLAYQTYLGRNITEAVQNIDEASSRASQMGRVLTEYCMAVKSK